MDIKSPVVFLDRDGVLCKEKSYVKNINELEIFDFADNAVKRMKQLGFKAIVITNQSGVARGIIDEKELIAMHRFLKEKVSVDEIYYCPHLPPSNNNKEDSPHLINCTCRKPFTGLIQQAEKEYYLDLQHAYFVGDRAVDIQTGQAIGATTVLLESGYGTQRLELQVRPDLVFKDLPEFVRYLEEQTRTFGDEGKK